MTVSEIEKALTSTKTQYKVTGSTFILFFDGTKEQRIGFLQKIAATYKGTYSKNFTPKSSVGGVTVGSVKIITKPSKNVNGSLASLDARIFSSKGKKIEFPYGEAKISAFEFSSKQQIKDSIANGIQNASMIDDSIIDGLEQLYANGNLDWGIATDEATKNKLGVYLGEMLVGIVALNDVAVRSHYLSTNIFGSKAAKRFIIPNDPSFSGVDSFVELSDGELISISSKYGVGAKASIFTNLLPKGMEEYGQLENSIFTDILRVIKENNFDPSDSKKIVYEYGLRNILGIGKTQIPNSQDVFKAIVAGKVSMDSPAGMALARAANHKELPENIKKLKPENLSNFFNNVTARRLNADKKSIDIAKEILAGKKFVQLNLDKPLWLKGNLKFSVVVSDAVELKFNGQKSPADDVTCKQGWINYELKPKP